MLPPVRCLVANPVSSARARRARAARGAARVLAALCALAPALAGAWTWAHTEATGAPLRWPQGAEIPWQSDPSLDSAAAVAAWLEPGCAGRALPLATRRQRRPGGARADAGGAVADAPNAVRWVHAAADWPVGADVVAFTAVRHDAGTGVISGFELWVNGATQSFCSDAASCAGAQFHLPSTLLHEWGHVWGLGHSARADAAMTGMRYPGEVRDLPTQDDRDGLCALYPAPAGVPDAGCAAASEAPRSGAPWPVFLLLVAAGALVARRRAAPLLVTLALIAPSLAVAPAWAYVQATVKSGAHQRWIASEIPYRIEAKGLVQQGISDAEVQAAMARAFATWSAVQCAVCHDARGVACAPVPCDSHPLGVTFRFEGTGPERAPVGCADGSTPGPDNDTCVPVPNGSQLAFVAQDWPHGSTVIATTVVAANTLTGEIADADIQLNTAGKTFCVQDSSCQLMDYDLDNTLTHEVGHLLGLDHSLDGDATMFGGAPPGETLKRDLHPDDVLGVCMSYRQAWAAGGCPVADDGGCCAVAAGPPSGPGGAAIAGMLALLALALRRARPRSA